RTAGYGRPVADGPCRLADGGCIAAAPPPAKHGGRRAIGGRREPLAPDYNSPPFARHAPTRGPAAPRALLAEQRHRYI
ncbi:DeoR/GlpR transcriptional regulator, partial [Burkholderia pseudomallei]